jgi:hypothetical protein
VVGADVTSGADEDVVSDGLVNVVSVDVGVSVVVSEDDGVDTVLATIWSTSADVLTPTRTHT